MNISCTNVNKDPNCSSACRGSPFSYFDDGTGIISSSSMLSMGLLPSSIDSLSSASDVVA